MCIQLYVTRLKCLFRNRSTMFWCYMFPILLATCFYFAFNNLWKIDDFETIPIAYDSQNAAEDSLGEVLEAAQMSEDLPMFQVKLCSHEEAKKLLADGAIEAYIVGGQDPELYVKANSMNVTIIKSFLDNYRQMADAVSTILTQNPNAIQDGLLKDVTQYQEFVKEKKSEKEPQTLLVYFYALMAYTCIFAANWGLDEVVNIQANLSGQGARLNVSPMNKMKLFLCNLAAACTAHLGSMLLLFLYMYYIIKIDFGSNLGYLLFICVIGSICGLAIGGTVGVWVKKRVEVKEAILTIAILGGGFLSGMMVSSIKYTIHEKFPILGYINPVNLISDAMYSLYYYDTYQRFYQDAGLLCLITFVLCIASYVGIRRKNYASL